MSRVLRVPLVRLGPGPLVLTDAAARYVSRVHRLVEGDVFVGFDPDARVEADVVVASIGRAVHVRVGELRPASSVARTRVTLLQSLGKGDKPDQIVRDATALGASRIVLLESERAVVRVGERAEPRRERWRTIAAEAARQSGRGDLPVLDGPVPLAAALESVESGDVRLCLSPRDARPLAAALAGWDGTAGVALLVGPEGGLTAGEEERAVAAGFARVTLGPFTLRMETAAVAALGVVVALADRHPAG